MLMLKYLLSILIGFGSGAVISGAVFAFIAVIGIVPSLAKKTCTGKYVKIYEEAIICGGVFGALTGIVDFYLPMGKIIVVLLSFCIGVFVGSLAISLAEIIDVIPILSRRVRVQRGMTLFIFSIAFGKMTGSLLYYLVPGFFEKFS